MYSKIYRISCNDGQGDALLDHYDSHVAPAIKDSERHVGHHMVQTDSDSWLLVSTYHSRQDAESALPMVQELVGPMIENYGMTMEILGEGEVTRS